MPPPYNRRTYSTTRDATKQKKETCSHLLLFCSCLRPQTGAWVSCRVLCHLGCRRGLAGCRGCLPRDPSLSPASPSSSQQPWPHRWSLPASNSTPVTVLPAHHLTVHTVLPNSLFLLTKSPFTRVISCPLCCSDQSDN